MLAVRETPAAYSGGPRLLDRVRHAIRARHYSRRTEKAYVGWIKRYIFFHGKRHPDELGAADVSRFLTALAVDRKVAASTQNQAMNALVFLYRVVLEQDLPWLDDVVRARRPQHLPMVFTREEVRDVLARLDGLPRLDCTAAVRLWSTAARVPAASRQGRRLLRESDHDSQRERRQRPCHDAAGHREAEPSRAHGVRAPAARGRYPARRRQGVVTGRAGAEVPSGSA
jgi:hypothetical protein